MKTISSKTIIMTVMKGKQAANTNKQRTIYLQIVIYVSLIIHTTGFLVSLSKRSSQYSSKQEPIVEHRCLSLLLSAQVRDDDDLSSVMKSDCKETKRDSRLWYKRANGMWRPRINIEDLKVGQRLFATKLDNAYDLLDGKTGPKLFYECGVGRFTHILNEEKEKIQIMRPCNGMLRLGGPNLKPSVVKKKRDRLVKLQKRTFIGNDSEEDTGIKMLPVWVTRVFPSAGRFEITTSEEEAMQIAAASKSDYGITKVSASKLVIGQERIGKVVKLKPYGVMVDVGVSRLGLLHITTVADFFGKYIDKQKGLKEAGLEMGAMVKLCVKSNLKKRLELDFTEEAKSEMRREKELLNANKNTSNENKSDDESKIVFEMSSNEIQDDEEAAMWAQFAAPGHEDDKEDDDLDEDYDYDDEEYSTYDEERDIESSLGLDYY